MGRAIGIDLGTTKSLVAYVEGSSPRVILASKLLEAGQSSGDEKKK